MNENLTPQDKKEIITTTSLEDGNQGYKPPIQWIVYQVKRIQMFFSQPISYFKEYKPRQFIFLDNDIKDESNIPILRLVFKQLKCFIGGFLDMIFGLFSLAFIAGGIILGTLAPQVFGLYVQEWAQRDMDFWEYNITLFWQIILVVWISGLTLYNIVKRPQIKEMEPISIIKANLKVMIISFIPIAIGFLILYLKAFFFPDWWDPETMHWTNVHTDNWKLYHPYFTFFIIIMLIPMFLFNLITNKNNKELGIIRRVIFNLRLTFKIGAPMVIAFTFWFIAILVDPFGWNTYKMANYLLLITFSCIIWTMILFGSNIYVTTGNKKLSIVFPLVIIIGLVIFLQYFAIKYNDVYWQAPTIIEMVRWWFHEVAHGVTL